MHSRQNTVATLLALLAALVGVTTLLYLACKPGLAFYGFLLLVGWSAIALAIFAITKLDLKANGRDQSSASTALLNSSWLLIIAGFMIFVAAIGTIVLIGKLTRPARPVAIAPTSSSLVGAQPIVWAQLQPSKDGLGIRILARAIVDAAKDCPAALVVDGKEIKPGAMTTRPWTTNENFPIRICEIELDKGQSVRIGDVQLDPPPTNPTRIVVIGDSGCRIVNYQAAQRCNIGQDWPLETIAAAVKRAKPDLIVHVGDYHYRESPCNGQDGCEPSPFGDTWSTWQTEFFRPAATILTAAPWIMVRGNHEDCERAYTGWDYLLSLRPRSNATPKCGDEEPYALPFDHLTMTVLDTANAEFKHGLDQRGEAYRKRMDDLKLVLQKRSGDKWLLLHQPFWVAYVGLCDESKLTCSVPSETDPKKIKQDAIGQIRSWIADEKELKFSLVLSGHTHNFQLFAPANPSKGLPLQLVAGMSGTALDRWTAKQSMLRQRIAATLNGDPGALWVDHEFGFVLLTKNNDVWTVGYHDMRGNERMNCPLANDKTACTAR